MAVVIGDVDALAFDWKVFSVGKRNTYKEAQKVFQHNFKQEKMNGVFQVVSHLFYSLAQYWYQSSMPKMSYSILIAIGVHIIVLLFSGLYLGSEDAPMRNLINVQFGSGSGSSAGKSLAVSTSKKAVGETKTASSKKEIALNSSPTSESAAGTAQGSGAGNSMGSGSGSGFDDSVTSFSEPIYPKLAIKRGLEGQVRLRVEVSAEGSPEKITILESSKHEILDRAALEGAKNWRFQKRSSPYAVEKNIIFKLRG